jgi:hypothetical protein
MTEYTLLDTEVTKGVVKSVGQPVKVSTKYGERAYLPVEVDINGTVVTLRLWVSPNKTVLHPKSTAYRLFRRLGIKRSSELVGKEVPLRVDSNGFHRFDI